jgi:hypothetical protein
MIAFTIMREGITCIALQQSNAFSHGCEYAILDSRLTVQVQEKTIEFDRISAALSSCFADRSF